MATRRSLTKIHRHLARVGALFAVVAVAITSISHWMPVRAEDSVREYVEGICEYGGEPHPYGHELEKSNLHISFYDGDFEAAEGGDTSHFKIEPYSFAYGVSLRRIIIIPDSQTDVGEGAGAEKSIRTSYADSAWFLNGTYSPGFPGITVKAVGDGDDESEHLSTIRFAVECSSAAEEKIIELCTVMDIRIRYGSEEPPDVHRGFRNSCEHPAPPVTETPSIPSSQDPASPSEHAAPTQREKPIAAHTALGQDAFLNELESYTNGTGEVLWLRPQEGARFKLALNDKDEHTIRLQSLGDKSATMVIASTPQEITLEYDESRKIDVDRNGQEDIEITMLTIAAGQAGIKVKPLTKAAAAPTIQVPVTAKVTRNMEKVIGAGIIVLAGVGALLWVMRKRLYKKGHAKRSRVTR